MWPPFPELRSLHFLIVQVTTDQGRLIQIYSLEAAMDSSVDWEIAESRGSPPWDRSGKAERTAVVMYLDEAGVRALAAFFPGAVLQPVRNTIEEGKRYLGIMSSVGPDAMSLKLVSFSPANEARTFPPAWPWA
jgi:hypothetical protein